MARRASRFWLWTAPLTAGAAAAIVLAAGFVLALRGAIGDPIGEPPPPAAAPRAQPAKDGERRILVVGDSLARGTGDETGRGFAVDLLDAFRKSGKAQLTNLGVGGTESPEIRALVESPTVRARAAEADLIVVSAGGNDLSHAASGASRSASPSGLADAVTEARARYVESLRGILRALREANPSAPIAVVGLYDPFSGEGAGRLESSVILQWNNLATETALAFPGVTVVPTFDIFQGRADRLSADRYHPNRKSYAMIAERILQAVGE